MPVEILVGEEDKLTPPYLSQELGSLFAQSSLTILSGVGHLSSIEAPDKVTEMITNLLGKV